MAEINIERKKRSGWGILLALILLALLAWAVYAFFFKNDTHYEQHKNLDQAPVGMMLNEEEPIYLA